MDYSGSGRANWQHGAGIRVILSPADFAGILHFKSVFSHFYVNEGLFVLCFVFLINVSVGIFSLLESQRRTFFLDFKNTCGCVSECDVKYINKKQKQTKTLLRLDATCLSGS